MKSRCSRASALLSILFTVGARGADDHDHHHFHEPPVDEIVVTADPLSGVDAHFAAPVAVLTADDLRKESLRSIGEAVSNQLGVTSGDFGTSVGRPVIRGLGGGRVRVLEDGIGSMDVSTISADHGVPTEPLFAQQIEILRGPATLLYGSGASGGLINIANGRILSTMPDALEAEIVGQYDTASNGRLGALTLDAPIAPYLALHFDALGRTHDDVDIPGFAERAPDPDARAGMLPNSSADASTFAGGLSVIFADAHAGFSITEFAHEYGVPGAHAHEDEPAGTAPHDVDDGTRIDQTQRRYDIDAGARVDRAMLERVKFRFGYGDYAHDEIEATGEVATAFRNEEWESRIELLLQPIGRWDAVIGFQFRDKDFAATGEEAFVPSATLASQALFVFAKADFEPLHVDLGLRLETQDAETRTTRASAGHNVVSVSLGAGWSLSPTQTIGFATSRSQRAPSIEELFASGPHLASNTFEIGDASLGEETSTSLDVFWRRQAADWAFDFTLFYNHISDFVYLASSDRNGDGVADRVEDTFLDDGAIVAEDDALLLVTQRQRDATFRGFELEISRTLLDDARGRATLRLWTDFVDAEFDDGSAVPRMPPLRFGANADWVRGPAYGGIAVVRTTSADDPAALETRTAANTLLNLHAGFTFALSHLDLTLFAQATNVLDDDIRRHVSLVKDLAPQPGVSGLFGVRATF